MPYLSPNERRQNTEGLPPALNMEIWYIAVIYKLEGQQSSNKMTEVEGR